MADKEAQESDQDETANEEGSSEDQSNENSSEQKPRRKRYAQPEGGGQVQERPTQRERPVQEQVHHSIDNGRRFTKIHLGETVSRVTKPASKFAVNTAAAATYGIPVVTARIVDKIA